jgi:PKD repeat protein
MESDPVHTFSAPGLYETCLTVSNTYGEDTFCRTIELLASSVSGQAPRPLLYVYPNPAADRITVVVPDADIATVHIRITSAVGSVVYQGLHSVMDGRATLDVQQLVPGIYYCTAYGQHKIPGGAVISIVR